MARPKREPDKKPAFERIEDAFWDILSEKPFDKITISELSREVFMFSGRLETACFSLGFVFLRFFVIRIVKLFTDAGSLSIMSRDK